jgi:hypothetical protein
VSWIIKWQGQEFSSDDFLLEDLAEVEKSTGTPWSTANPYREVSVAKAFLAVAMLRQGASEKEVVEELKKVTLKTLKTSFVYYADEDEGPPEEVDPSARSRAKTGRSSSRGRPVKGGSRPIQESSASETSSPFSERKIG